MIRAKIEGVNFNDARRLHLNFFHKKISTKLNKYKHVFELLANTSRKTFPLREYKKIYPSNTASGKSFLKSNKVLFASNKSRFTDYVQMLNFFNQYCNVIIAGKPATLESVIEDFNIFSKNEIERHIKGEEKWNDIFAKTFVYALNKIYDYEAFSNGFTQWGAYQLSSKLNVRVCLYCNRSYTFTVFNKDDEPIIRPEFDHFYCQKWFPFLAISFYNLIPSCHNCNSTLKGATKLNITEYMHPYLEGYENVYKFRTGYDLPKYLAMGHKILPEIDIKMQSGFVSANNNIRANNNIELFHILPIYKHHKEVAEDIFHSAYMYKPSVLKGLMTIGGAKPLIPDKYDLYKNVLNNYWKHEDFGKAPLSKFTRDIAEETGLYDTIQKLIKT